MIKRNLGPISFNGKFQYTLEVSGVEAIHLQMVFKTGTTRELLWRTETSDGLTYTRLDTAEGLIGNGGDCPIKLNPAKKYYLYFTVITDAGVPIAGGAKDYLYVAGDVF